MQPQPPNAEPRPTARVVYQAAIASGAIVEDGRNWHLSEDEIKRRKLRPCDREGER